MNDSPSPAKSPPSGTPAITSFVIRFVHPQNHPHSHEMGSPAFENTEQTGSGGSGPGEIYRGTIRHVQSDREIVFTDWHEAVAFIQNYVPIIDAR